MDHLAARIADAFVARICPVDGEITRCAYDRVNGGTMGGPCWECEEMSAYFAGKPWQSLGGEALRCNGQADALFTVEAYCYFLPAYLLAAIREPRVLDVCLDHLAYRCGPKPGESWPAERLAHVLRELTSDERAAVHAYFAFALSRDDDWDGYIERALRNLAAPPAGEPLLMG